jgi:CBS domain-containing protein
MALQVRHAMTEAPKSLGPERTADDAAGLMAQFDFGSVPIVDGEELVGIVTDRDLVVRVIANRQDPHEVELGEIATKTVTTVTPDTELADARGVMEREKVRRLPVVKQGALVGMLSLGDVAVALSSDRQVGEALKEISESPSTQSLNDGPAVGTP